MLQSGPWIPAVLTAICAAVLDWRYRRIPNWLTVSGLLAGIGVNTALFGLAGMKAGLLGVALGLGLLLPFVLLRSLGVPARLARAAGAVTRKAGRGVATQLGKARVAAIAATNDARIVAVLLLLAAVALGLEMAASFHLI